MSNIYAITNQKGGVGKTTTTINLAASLTATGQRVLLIDIDPQGNATIGSGIDKSALDVTVTDLLLAQRASQDAIVRAEYGGYDVIGADSMLTVAEVRLLEMDEREYRLRKVLWPLTGRYTFILLDCPPTLSTLTVNALVAATGIIIPVQCEYYALEGLSSLLQTIQRIRETVSPELKIEGVLRTMFDPRNNLSRDVSERLRERFGDSLYQTIIPRNVSLAEAPSHGMPTLQYDKRARGAQAYLMLAGEILSRAAATK